MQNLIWDFPEKSMGAEARTNEIRDNEEWRQENEER